MTSKHLLYPIDELPYTFRVCHGSLSYLVDLLRVQPSFLIHTLVERPFRVHQILCTKLHKSNYHSLSSHLASKPSISLATVELHALLEAVGDGALACSSCLSESSRASERSSGSAVSDTHDTDVVGTADRSIARHACGHLDRQREVRVGGKRQTLDTQAGNVLRDLCSLESVGIGATGSAIDICGKGTGTVLVDLDM